MCGGGRKGHIYFVRSIGIKILPLAFIEMSIPRPIISTFSGSILSNEKAKIKIYSVFSPKH